jgi:hypothetical protein
MGCADLNCVVEVPLTDLASRGVGPDRLGPYRSRLRPPSGLSLRVRTVARRGLCPLRETHHLAARP